MFPHETAPARGYKALVEIQYRSIRSGEDEAAAAVVIAAFEEFIAPGFAEEGIEEFRTYAHAEAIRARRSAGQPHRQFVALAPAGMTQGARSLMADTIVGIGEIRAWQHVSMLFVHPDWLQLGIGKELFARLRDEVGRENPDLAELTVNSSPFAVPIYERLGFVIAGDTLVISGIKQIPMTFDLTS